MKNRESGRIPFLFWRIHHGWDRKVRRLREELDSQEEVTLAPDEETSRLYPILKNSTKKPYRKRAEEFERLLSLVERHNEAVRKAEQFLSSFSEEEILSNPHALMERRREEIQEGVDLVSSFSHVRREEKEQVRKAKEVLANQDEIQAQFDRRKELEGLRSLSKEGYLTVEEVEERLSREREILGEVRKKSRLYYDFSEDPDWKRKVEEHNAEWLKKKAQDPLFDSVNGRSLDLEQRFAVLKPEKRNLVIAGAGSGKTLTICGKVKYLLEREKVSPEKILLLSYSRKSAEDLKKKVDRIHPGLAVHTFHSLGLSILNQKNGKPLLVEEQFDALLEAYFRDVVPTSPSKQRDVLCYLALFSYGGEEKKYRDEGERLVDLKGMDVETLRSKLLSYSNDREGKETLKKERVKSYEELAIANWYYLNGIDYVYEAPYERDVSTWDHRQYKPDFYLKDYHVYHEHYGIGKDGTARQFGEEASKAYVASMAWKRKLHELCQTDCIETYSYEFQDGTVFTKLEAELRKRNIPLRPISQKQVREALSSLYHGRSFSSLLNLLRSFLHLYKARYPDETRFDALSKVPFGGLFSTLRQKLFLKIAKDVYLYYRQALEKDHKIDFDDMILSSTAALDSLEGFRYEKILVDEFQDISYSRMLFLKKLLEHGKGELFAVGDDFQSIYRFAGSDLSLFVRFGDFFGPHAVSKITTTYRNSQELQDIVSPFIQKNPEQIPKNLRSSLHLDHPVKVRYSSAMKEEDFLTVLKEISRKDPKAHVLVLGRNKADFLSIAQDERIRFRHGQGEEGKILVSPYPNLTLRYSTVHASKGLEEETVILINVDEGRLGFPNTMEDDPLLSLVLGEQSHYPFGEERRLFYVALTRTRGEVYLIADREHPSRFLQEILPQCEVLNPEEQREKEESYPCPKCRSGTLVPRKDVHGHLFYGCSNYPFCDYAIGDVEAVQKRRRCPVCGDYLVLRQGRYGTFYGCHSYPYCRYTVQEGPYPRRRK